MTSLRDNPPGGKTDKGPPANDKSRSWPSAPNVGSFKERGSVAPHPKTLGPRTA